MFHLEGDLSILGSDGGYQFDAKSALGIAWTVKLVKKKIVGGSVLHVCVHGKCNNNNNNNNCTSSWRAVIQPMISVYNEKGDAISKESGRLEIRDNAHADLIAWEELVHKRFMTDIFLFLHLTIFECTLNNEVNSRLLDHSIRASEIDIAYVEPQISKETLLLYARPSMTDVANGGYLFERRSALGIEWQVGLVKETVDGTDKMVLTVFGSENKKTSRRAQIDSTFIACNKDALTKDLVQSRVEIVSDERKALNYLDWNDLIDPSYNFVVDDLIYIRIILCIESAFDDNSKNNIVNPRKRKLDHSTRTSLTDFRLLIEGQSVYVGRQFLATFSPYFDHLLFGDYAGKEEMALADVNYEDFLLLINQLYPLNQPLEDSTVEILLELAVRFEVEVVLSRVENFLIESISIPLSKKLLLSDRYALTTLKEQCLSQLTDKQAVRKLAKEEEYNELSDGLKVTLLEVFLPED